MFCKIFKLISGEIFIAQTDSPCIDMDSTISIINPVTVILARLPSGEGIVETYVMQPWLKTLAKNDVMQLPLRHVLIAADVTDYIQQQYIKYVDDIEHSSDEGNIDEDFETVEDFINDLIETYGDQEEDDNERPTTRRTLH